MMLQQREEQWQTQPQMLISQMHLQIGFPELPLLLSINNVSYNWDDRVQKKSLNGTVEGSNGKSHISA